MVDCFDAIEIEADFEESAIFKIVLLRNDSYFFHLF